MDGLFRLGHRRFRENIFVGHKDNGMNSRFIGMPLDIISKLLGTVRSLVLKPVLLFQSSPSVYLNPRTLSFYVDDRIPMIILIPTAYLFKGGGYSCLLFQFQTLLLCDICERLF